MKKLFILAIITLFLSACASTPDHPAFNDAGYAAWLESTAEKIKKKSDYRRIPIDTEEQENHFIALSYKAYKKEIGKKEFIQEMNSKYPGYSESIEWNARQLPD